MLRNIEIKNACKLQYMNSKMYISTVKLQNFQISIRLPASPKARPSVDD